LVFNDEVLPTDKRDKIDIAFKAKEGKIEQRGYFMTIEGFLKIFRNNLRQLHNIVLKMGFLYCMCTLASNLDGNDIEFAYVQIGNRFDVLMFDFGLCSPLPNNIAKTVDLIFKHHVSDIYLPSPKKHPVLFLLTLKGFVLGVFKIRSRSNVKDVRRSQILIRYFKKSIIDLRVLRLMELVSKIVGDKFSQIQGAIEFVRIKFYAEFYGNYPMNENRSMLDNTLAVRFNVLEGSEYMVNFVSDKVNFNSLDKSLTYFKDTTAQNFPENEHQGLFQRIINFFNLKWDESHEIYIHSKPPF